MNAQQRAEMLMGFRERFSRMLASTDTTGELVEWCLLATAAMPADVCEDARLWLVMEHGLDIDSWERRARPREKPPKR